jgi:hypothetical protein
MSSLIDLLSILFEQPNKIVKLKIIVHLNKYK